jgi:hypothetical protein
MPSSSSWVSARSDVLDRASITCAPPCTTTCSCTRPTGSVAFTVAVNDVLSASRSRRTVWNPVSSKVTVYSPGRRSTTWYRPSADVTAVLTRSMSAGLEICTVTPGSAAPESSVTAPTMAAADWAAPARAMPSTSASAATTTRYFHMVCLLPNQRTHKKRPLERAAVR